MHYVFFLFLCVSSVLSIILIRVRSTSSNLMPRGVKLCVRKNVNAWGNLLHDSGFSFWPVGDINHGFGRDISHNKVKSIVLMGLCNQFRCKLLGSLCALPSLHVRKSKVNQLRNWDNNSNNWIRIPYFTVIRFNRL